MLSWRPTNGNRYDSKVKQYPNLFVVFIQKRECRLVVADELGAEGYKHIASKFDVPEGYGAMGVRNFVAETDILNGRSADQWQQDAFGQVDAWPRALGFRG
ncbi:hypothetical protein HF251_11625 [Rhizobium leguminosarum]|uniref:hypothetical protein n=1 Tax=Rhizobium leguminosarum TaxID=384 RepID=UPI001C91854E|nr:hypothetical protein [Rhizobium leguminosarum]MBY2963348.1 hypothetical protein [Rhizobium leguminosarum]